MKLSVPERMALLEIMPAQSSYEGVTEIFRTINVLRLTDDEAIAIDVQPIEGSIQFNQEKAMTLITDIPIGEWMTNVIRKILRKIDEADELTINQMSLYEKFILDYS